MAKVATRFFGPAQTNGSPATTKYTVPAGNIAILRHVHLSNPSGAAVTFTMSIGADAAGVRIFDAYSVAQGSTYDWYGYIVVNAAEVIQTFAGTATTLVATAWGDLLSAG